MSDVGPIQTGTIVFSKEIIPGRGLVRVLQNLGFVEIEVQTHRGPNLYVAIGTADNPNILFRYSHGGMYRECARLETLARMILGTPPGAKPDNYKQRLPELREFMAAYRKGKALAARFAEHWRSSPNHSALQGELRRRYDAACRQIKGGGPFIHHDEAIALGAWLGAEEPIGQPHREVVSD